MPQPQETSPTRDDVRAAIVDAAARLLREQGSHAVTTRGVAEAAGVQAPAIYRLFGDKDGLLDAVAEHVMSTYVAAKASVATAESDRNQDPLEDLRNGWRVHVEFGLANPELFLLLSSPRRERSVATAAGAEVLRRRVHRLAAAGRLAVGEQHATDMIHAAGTGAVLTMLSTPRDQRDPALAGAMFDAVAAVILTDAPAGPVPELTSLAVTFATAVPQLPALTQAEQGLMTEWIQRSIVQLQHPSAPG